MTKSRAAAQRLGHPRYNLPHPAPAPPNTKLPAASRLHSPSSSPNQTSLAKSTIVFERYQYQHQLPNTDASTLLFNTLIIENHHQCTIRTDDQPLSRTQAQAQYFETIRTIFEKTSSSLKEALEPSPPIYLIIAFKISSLIYRFILVALSET